MKKIKLNPYVAKVKGATNYALFDLLNGKFYTITTEGDVEELKKSLLELGLAFETEGTVPTKIEIDLTLEKSTIRLRELQVRINGRSENNCRQRYKENKKRRFMNDSLLQLLEKELKFIPLKKLRIEAEIDESERIRLILEKLPFEGVELFVENGVSRVNGEEYRKICQNKNTPLTIMTDGERNISDLYIDIYDFFYNRHFNPCLGQQLAIDCGGEIKICLWAKKVFGTLGINNLRDMIISGVFDEYWELHKDKINVCQNCELKYVCGDCRVTEKGTWSMTEKPDFCKYNPFIGK